MARVFIHARKTGSIEAPMPMFPFRVGDHVHEIEETEIGTVADIRRDGLVNVVWKSGQREWIAGVNLCGPLAP